MAKTRTSRAGKALVRCPRPARDGHCEAGFSLIETLAVLAIVVIAATSLASLASSGRTAVEAGAFAQRLTALMRAARTEAIVSGRERVVLVDVARREVWSEGVAARALSFPDGLALTVHSAAGERRGRDVSGVRFYPDGGSSGAAIELSRGTSITRVRVNWLTGRISHDRS